ncbi:MAG: 2-oxoacid:acceptor oxidoreductase subunit alpha [Candidatus Daviesbacteria bacterium]|nr:2-oxoacid:acceptor oxidoreductase subunit alpha [Candidatus Daviesbacteria bacterium]
MAEKYSIKIGGSAGQGIKSAGLMLSKIATRSGLNIYTYTEYPSLIRGGHNVMQILISPEEVLAPSIKTDLLIALNKETIDLHLNELHDQAIILCDGEVFQGEKVISAPLSKLANEAGGGELLINTVALGATVGLLGGDLEILKNLITESFSVKPEIVEVNKVAAKSGYDFIVQNHADKITQTLKKAENIAPKMIINGNDGMALGAIAGGLQFASIYPMTPITGLLHNLALYQEQFGYIYKQPEDEISAINMAIGASVAGARALTATSGGGFCLMTEGLGLAGITETPVVVILGMRAGPSTGMPTWSENGDLQFALHAGHGDFPKIVLSAGDSREAFDLVKDALNLADKYQTPVILLVDKNICENDQSFHPLEISSQIDRGKLSLETIPDYQRYALSDDGISKRSVPGKGNFFIVNSDEHDEIGFSSEEIENRNSQMKKRMSKLQTCAKNDMPHPQIFGPQKADLTIVSNGSTKGAILESLKKFPNVNFLYLTWLNPFPADAVRNILAESKYILDIENNFLGQLADLIREKTGIEIMDKILKYDGRPIFPEEIEDKIRSIVIASDPPAGGERGNLNTEIASSPSTIAQGSRNDGGQI